MIPAPTSTAAAVRCLPVAMRQPPPSVVCCLFSVLPMSVLSAGRRPPKNNLPARTPSRFGTIDFATNSQNARVSIKPARPPLGTRPLLSVVCSLLSAAGRRPPPFAVEIAQSYDPIALASDSGGATRRPSVPSHELPGNVIYFAALAAGIGFFIYSVSLKLRVFMKAKADYRFDHLVERVTSLVPYLLGNSRVARKRYWYSGLLHTMIWWGFLVLQIRTLNFLIKGFNSDISFEHLGGFYYDVLVRAPMDVFNILVLIGCGMAAWQRRFWKPARMTFNTDAWIILFLIAFLMVTDIFTNSLEIDGRPRRRREVELRGVRPLARVGRHGALAGHARRHARLLVVRPPVRLPAIPQLPAVQQALARAHRHVQHRLPPHRADGPAPADQGLRERRAVRRRHHLRPDVEADARPVHVHGVRPLRDQLPGVPHRQGAVAEEDHARHAHGHRARDQEVQLAALRLGRPAPRLRPRCQRRLHWQRPRRGRGV